MMKKMKIRIVGIPLALFSAVVLLALVGCSSIGLLEVGDFGRSEYWDVTTGHRDLAPDTVNLLGNYLLHDLYRSSPEQFVEKLQQLYRTEPRREVLAALADCSLQIGYRESRDPDFAARFILASLLYSCEYLKNQDRESDPYDLRRLQILRIANRATVEFFHYLCSRRLERRSGFELVAAGGQTVRFREPVYRLPIAESEITDFRLCADIRPVHLTHNGREFGLGAPLIGCVSSESIAGSGCRYADYMTIPVTAVADFSSPWSADRRVEGGLHYIDSYSNSHIDLASRHIPLAADFTTPLAAMMAPEPTVNQLRRMLFPASVKEKEGLYHFEPFDPKRIPVVFVHGLMSDTRTWTQMLNTLRSDPELRRRYQFLGFTYSSGNPIFVSADHLRKALRAMREGMVARGEPTAAFDRMVLVGHSMGGLLSRLQITASDGGTLRRFTGVDLLEQFDRIELSDEEKRNIREPVIFKPAPFVRRVIFIAVPHRGSRLAETAVGRFGVMLIELPREFLQLRQRVAHALRKLGGTLPPQIDGIYTGIDNLKPDNIGLRYLNTLEIAPDVPLHSIVGNLRGERRPGGGDGVVPYSSSHLDQARSELIVRSGHSAHTNPLAVQEVRRILLLHLRECGAAEPKTAAARR